MRTLVFNLRGPRAKEEDHLETIPIVAEEAVRCVQIMYYVKVQLTGPASILDESKRKKKTMESLPYI